MYGNDVRNHGAVSSVESDFVRAVREASGKSNTGPANRPSQVEVAVNESDGTLRNCHDLLSTLEERLSIVLLSVPQSPEKERPLLLADRDGLVPLARNLSEQLDGMRSLRARLESILSRLEL